LARPAPGSEGGRPTRTCVLRPETDTTKTDTTPDADEPEEDDHGGGGPTQPPDETPPGSENAPDCGGCVGFGCVGPNDQPVETASPPGEIHPGGQEVVPEPDGEVLPESIRPADGAAPTPEVVQVYADTTDKTCHAGAGRLLVTDPADLGMVCAAFLARLPCLPLLPNHRCMP
jgi:hypothetical protein